MRIEFVFRIIGMVVLGIGGAWFGVYFSNLSNEPPWPRLSLFLGMVGCIAGLILTPYFTTRPMRAIRQTLTQVSSKTLFAGTLGLVISLVVSALLAFPLSLLPEPFGQVLPVLLALAMCYLGVSMFISRQNDILEMWSNFPGRSGNPGPEGAPQRVILMDTSVIIDGRISDIARTGFIPGNC